MCEKGRRGQSVKKLVLHAARSERTIHSRSDEKMKKGMEKRIPAGNPGVPHQKDL